MEKCYQPLVKSCNEKVDATKMICKNMHETKCSTKYVEKQKGMFVGDTKCEKLPSQFCAATGCQFVSGRRRGTGIRTLDRFRCLLYHLFSLVFLR